MRTKSLIVIFLCSVIFFISGCSKNDKNAVFQLRLTDSPAEYDQVLIDIQDVQIHVTDNDNGGNWQSMEVNKGIYNLLDFRNGMDTLLAYIELPAGKISQMRLVLGSDNKVMVDEELYDLRTPSAQQSGLKFNIHATLIEGIVYTLWIDFDAARSVVLHKNSGYLLKPVIRTFTNPVSGAISGIVSPADAMPHVMAVANNDTFGTYTSEDGHFLIRAIPENMYSVTFEPVTPYSIVIVDNVFVVTGSVTVLDTVYF